MAERIVIVGGGFGGLYAAKELGKSSVEITLIDKRNFHLFQPLIYQVATGALSPEDIASPLRSVLNKNKNIEVLKDEVIDLDPINQTVITNSQKLLYDKLIIATGAVHHYFDNNEWQRWAPGLKTIEDALQMRRKIFQSFEEAEKEKDREKRKSLMTFVVVGGGPTGVELAGALAELAHHTLKEDFRNINPQETKVILIEAGNRILPTYPEKLSIKSQEALEKLGVSVQTKTIVTHLGGQSITVGAGESSYQIMARTTLWAAGVKASGFGSIVAGRTGAFLDKMDRIVVEPDLSIAGFQNIFVIGDLANFSHQDGKALPGIAPVAMQKGRYVARLIKKDLKGKKTQPFRFRNKGALAVIGRNAAVADLGKLKISGLFAWLIWVFVHIAYLIEFGNRVIVLFQWG